jgi:hypothetical protein
MYHKELSILGYLLLRNWDVLTGSIQKAAEILAKCTGGLQ